MKKYGALIVLVLLWIFIPITYVVFALRYSFFTAETVEIITTLEPYFHYLNIGLIILLAILAILLLSLALLIKRNVVSVCRWLGNAFLISGLVGSVALLIQRLLFSDNLERFQQYSDLLTQITFEVINSFLDILFWPFIITLGAGLILLSIAAIITGKKKKK
ncbi:hypothetical protein KKC88_02795 [Patescibacteria group bacterium]|nr:hypothetical protein [Patescibacteria group bacterium]MBU1672899.1 hypothetical protein [Patescibacteria group bacterium]MBU1963150.1 hypothetical protein [Patescibacteria group bacterium]